MAIKAESLDIIIGGARGFVPGPYAKLIEKNVEFIERALAETDPTYRQVIPYCLVEYVNIARAERGKHVMMRRKPKQQEQRLHGKLYIGAGGHVEEGHCVFYTALKELNEELGLPISWLDEIGLLVLEETEVDKVHVGIVYGACTAYLDFTSPEKDLHDAKWVTSVELKANVAEMEPWSQVLVNQMH